MATEQESYEVDSCVRQFHIYKHCWVPTIGEACQSHSQLTMMLFQQFRSLRSFPWLTETKLVRKAGLFFFSFDLKKLGIVTDLTCFFLLESLLNKPRVLHVTIIRNTLILRFFASFAKSQNLILAKFLCYTVIL